MSRGKIAVLVIVMIVISVVIFWLNADEETQRESGSGGSALISDASENVVPADSGDGSLFTLEMSSSGFSPQRLEINQGDTVRFANVDDERHWPATDVYPSHRVYPGSSIAKCYTEERSRIFDACRGVERGETYLFRFDEIGTWRYHDHLNPGSRGIIIVR